ncbi:SRPBCC domain-containing protein [Hoeflea sp. YIM 152468]|uniref:SRPBCC domain-containing protein n=1 Tax=Hoeflea sp. YIM 152468 TaxID=3031759 RepID=UPI0023DBCCAC|nr:SRPBCC domain-containing protein [Hoeflea sp. YIM 152468]MDF1609642.1 SRPBCC domain-containing protein [Hoeflea sp. YIM 152468]
MTDKIEICNDRLFPVDRATLYDAYADPHKLAQWWGPEGFSNTITAFDLKPGGQWRISMTADNGTDFHNRWTFDEVVEGRTVRMTHHEPVHRFTLEMSFADEGAHARLSWRMLFDRTEDTEAMEKFLHAANEQNFDRLQRVLQQGEGGN